MPESLSDWIGVIAAIGMILFGGGGIVAWFKLRDDSKKGVRQENRSDSDSLNAHAVAILEVQFNYLVKPLQGELETVRAKVASLEIEVGTHRTMYRLAIGHIQTLYGWIKRHYPDQVPPHPPTELAGDL